MKEYRIKEQTLDAIADEVQRLANLDDPLSPEEMRVALSKVTITDSAGIGSMSSCKGFFVPQSWVARSSATLDDIAAVTTATGEV